jgi:peptidyl-prolyl cis-trans isomerase A (cyclophilin A)
MEQPVIARRLIIIVAALALTALPAAAQPIATQPPHPPAPDMGRIVRVDLDTTAGRIVLELYPDKAPITVANFLHYVASRRYDGAKIFRAARAPGAPTFGLIQGGGFMDASKLFKPITLEPTSKTGLHHGDGAISMARGAPNSAQGDFFIVVGDSPSMDANPSAPGDNLGFAAFGRVAEGMEVVHAILAMPTGGRERTPTMQGQILTDAVIITTARVEK